MGFWGRHMQRRVEEADFSSPRAAVRCLELGIHAQLEDSVAQGAQTAARLLQDEPVTVMFLLDDLFASTDLMALVPPERVAEMLAEAWAQRAARTGLPTSCTVVSERSLAAAGLAMLGANQAPDAAIEVTSGYQGIEIKVPAFAKSYAGDVVPSCPLLAAVWQLLRQGRLPPLDTEPKWWREPPRSAERTFTVLNTSLMHVEVAAGVILDRYAPAAVEQLGYLFQPGHW